MYICLVTRMSLSRNLSVRWSQHSCSSFLAIVHVPIESRGGRRFRVRHTTNTAYFFAPHSPTNPLSQLVEALERTSVYFGEEDFASRPTQKMRLTHCCCHGTWRIQRRRRTGRLAILASAGPPAKTYGGDVQNFLEFLVHTTEKKKTSNIVERGT